MRDRAKRMVDLCVAGPAFVLLLPFMIIVGAVVYCTMGGPLLFRPMRPGYKAKPFRLFKFRTMTTACDSRGELLPDRDRLTRLGKFLRRYSLDELPQLWNVLRGDMSLVGPRPLPMQYLSRYSPEQARRHEVNPGLTGWAQVNGRNALDWEERFQLDIWYVDHRSFSLDAQILLKTLLKVLRGEDVSCRGHATMPEFLGNNPPGL